MKQRKKVLLKPLFGAFISSMCLGISSVYGDFISDVVNPVKASADIESIDAYPNVKQISHHLASHAAGSVIKHGYTVTDPRNGYYYIGFVSDGTFSSNGLTLVANEFYQADLKGGMRFRFNIQVAHSPLNFQTTMQIGQLGDQ